MKYWFTLLFLMVLPVVSAGQAVDVVLIGGQSNATGQGRVNNIPASFVADQRVQLFASSFLCKSKKGGKWVPLCPASEGADRFGVELSLGTALQKRYPDKTIALIKHALSGANIYAQWNPGNITGNQGEEYSKFIQTVQAAMSALKEQGMTPVIRAMVWQQGEGDARDIAGMKNSAAYGENLKNFIEQVRKDVASPEMLFVYGEVMPMEAKRFPGRMLVRQAQKDVSEAAKSPLSVKGAICVEGDDLQMVHSDYRSPTPKDDVHLGTFGILTLGERFAAQINLEEKKKESGKTPES